MLSKGGRWIFNARNDHIVRVVHAKARLATDEAVQMLTAMNRETVLHPFVPRSGTLTPGFTVQCLIQSATNSHVLQICLVVVLASLYMN